MTRNEIRELIKKKYTLSEEGEGDSAGVDAAGSTSGSSAAGSTDTVSATTTSSSSSNSTSSDSSYTKDDILFGSGSSDSSNSSGGYGGVSSGSGDIAPSDNPFQDDEGDEQGKMPVEEPIRYEVIEMMEKDPNYPNEKDYVKVRNLKTNEIKIFPLSEIDLA